MYDQLYTNKFAGILADAEPSQSDQLVPIPNIFRDKIDDRGFSRPSRNRFLSGIAY